MSTSSYKKPVGTLKPQQSKTDKPQTTSQALSFSLIIPVDHQKESIPFLIESFQKTRPESQKNMEIVLVGQSNDPAVKLIQENSFCADLIQQKKLSIIPSTTPNAFATGLANATKKYAVLFNIQHLAKPINLNDLFLVKRPENKENIAIYFNFSNENVKKLNILSPLSLMNTQYARYAFADAPAEGFENMVYYKLKKSGADVSLATISQNHPYSSKAAAPSFLQKTFSSITNCFKWNYILPLNELKSKPHLEFDFIKENSIYRFIFSALITLMFFGMSWLSLDAGISGDEPVQYEYAQKVVKYYTSMGKDTTALAYSDSYHMPFYGSSFDNITAFYNNFFHVDNIYETRHVMNALCGWATILFAGLLVLLIGGGWRAGIITILLLFLSPRFLGHSFNNPKDIPFAMGYIMAIYFIVRFLKTLPEIKIKSLLYIALGIAIAISVRIGGLLLVAYLFLFAGMYFLIYTKGKIFKKDNFNFMFRLIFILGGVSLAGYLIGLILWPYALQSPFKHPFEALKLMENFATSLRQIFEGKIIWSDHAPWNYLPKYIFITIPIAVILGFALFCALFFQAMKKYSFMWMFILLFAFAFPIFYIIYKHSNVYGGWRHVIFAYPTLVVASALGYETLLRLLKNNIARIVTLVVLAVLLFLPLKHIIKNHPHEYVYYNEIVGGLDKAWGFYETDYYYNGIRAGAEWLKKDLNLKDMPKPAKKIVIGSNHLQILNYYFRHDTDKVDFAYIRYFERGNVDWDYAIFVNSYMDPYQLQKNIFPPKNTIYSVTVDGKPICIVLKRGDKSDLLGSQYAARHSVDTAITYLNRAIKDVPTNEAALLNLTEIYMNMQKYDTALKVANQLLAVYPDYENGLNYQGFIYMYKNDLDNALKTFQHIIRVNFKFVYGYFGMAQVYLRKNDANSAINYLKQAIDINQGFKPAYMTLAQIYQFQAQQKSQQGDKNGAQESMAEAQKYADIAKQL
ncbi:MAG: tetratricopeptide repeat protein [Bacteroidota bacterium]